MKLTRALLLLAIASLTKTFSKPLNLLIKVAFCLLPSAFCLLTPVWAQPTTSSIHFVPPPPPNRANRGAPTGRSRGGASRGSCQVNKEPLTAIVPATPYSYSQKQAQLSTNNTSEIVFAQTVSERPSFWFYVPYKLNPDIPIEFVLQDEQQKNDVTSLTISSSTPGVAKISFPATSAPLEIGKMYHWYFLVYCDTNRPVFVEGWVQRVAIQPTLNERLQKATPRERVALLANNGIWYDAIAQLAILRQTHPHDTNLIADWKSLLESVGLGAIASEPIVDCCSLYKGLF
ncbi:MAG: DUF928 domain-containing protein [Hydrococcus sp. Prado102]|jgi:hypothetical protein|nr:DUF928 domain-containing protein [Hydrococcus sp. Prado102]